MVATGEAVAVPADQWLPELTGGLLARADLHPHAKRALLVRGGWAGSRRGDPPAIAAATDYYVGHGDRLTSFFIARSRSSSMVVADCGPGRVRSCSSGALVAVP
jgi:hypothetical protein